MNDTQVVPQGVVVYFKTTKFESPDADSDRRIVVAGLKPSIERLFYNKLMNRVTNLVTEHTEYDVVVDLLSNDITTKYEFMDQVILALQDAGVKITRD